MGREKPYMMKPESKKEIADFTILLVSMYMISYVTRINFGAIISEMERETGWSRSLLSMPITGSFITYGAGQIISGVMGDKFSPKKLVLSGLIFTTSINFLMPFANNPYQMLVLWCVNGFAQSFMWPPVAKLMTELLSPDDYKKTAFKVSWGSSFGTIAVYLCSPIIITFFGWRAVFVFSAILGAVMMFLWNKYSYDIEIKKIEKKKEESKSRLNFFSPVIFGIMIAIVFQGMLRDGVTTWMPSYILETYNLSSIISILTGVLLPFFSILCSWVSTALYMKKLKNPLVCTGVFFLSGTLAAAGLFAVTGYSASMSVLLSAVLTGCMHGVNIILTSMVPPFFKKTGNVSTVSGVLNSCTYIGSAISTYGIALVSERLGWNFTILIWLIIALAGTFVCFLCARPWRKKHQFEKDGI